MAKPTTTPKRKKPVAKKEQFHAASTKGQAKVTVNLGIPSDLHEALAKAAQADERSVNHFCVMLLKRAMVDVSKVTGR